MLNFIRQYRGLFTILVALVAVAMIVSLGLGGTQAGGGMSMAGVAAKVEGKEISKRELLQQISRQMQQMEQTLNQQMGAMGGNAENRAFLENLMRSQVTPERVLEQLIQQEYRITTAEKLGYVASKPSIRHMIQSNPAFQKNGVFDPVLYKEMVAEPGRYEKLLAQEAKFIGLSDLFQTLGAMVSPLEVKQNELLELNRSFELLAVNPATFPDPKQVTPEQVAAFLNSPDANAKIEAFYNKNIARFKKDEQVQARHILIKGDNAESKIASIRADIEGKKITFEEAAKKYSEDASNASRGGDLGLFGRGVMDPAFEKAAFALKNKNELSAPVKSSFGFHLIQLVERRGAEGGDMAQIRSRIASEVLLEDLRVARAKSWLSGFAKANKAPTPAELKSYGLSWSDSTAWKVTDPQLGGFRLVGDKLGSLLKLQEKGSLLGEVLTSQDNKLYLVRLKSIQKSAEPLNSPDPKTPIVDPIMQAADQKIQESFRYYLENRFKDLEKRKKIVRSDKVLQELRQALEPAAQGG